MSALPRLAALGAVCSLCAALSAATAVASESCPNAALRTGPAATMASCRAYELVTPDINHAVIASGNNSKASAGGDTLVLVTADAPEHASSAQPSFNPVRATRDGLKGWSGVSLSPPVSTPVSAYRGFVTVALSTDLSATVEFSDQPLSGGPPNGANVFVGRADGTYRQLTPIPFTISGIFHSYGFPAVFGGTSDFSHVYFSPTTAQLPEDTLGGSVYSWSEEHGLRLLGILPDGTPAPNAVRFAGNSADGRYAAFLTNDQLYLRIDESHTVPFGTSQRTVSASLPAVPAPVGMSTDGRYYLFTSRSELTNDANTGRSGGVATNAGRDLYRYDIATNELKDLSVSTNPADAVTGANVLSTFPSPGIEAPAVRASADGSIVYFIAEGNLAPGATPGRTALYVWHDDRVDFVADADGIVRDPTNPEVFDPIYVSPDGKHLAFSSTDSLTAYDNTDPVTGSPHSEVFLATLGSPLVCASCRPDGTRPTGDSNVPAGGGLSSANVRVVSDDGGRLFFHSRDGVLPQASGGRQQVYEYAGGKISPISRLGSPFEATFQDASASGDDVFFKTHDDLVPNPNSGDDAIFDARVRGGFPAAEHHRCSGLSCQAPPAREVTAPIAASVTFVSDGNVQPNAGASAAATRVSVSKVSTITGTTGAIKVRVPRKGTLTVAGAGVVGRRVSSSKMQTITVRLALTTRAARALSRQRTFRTKARVRFTAADGRSSTVTVPLTFKSPTTRKGR